VTAEHGLTLDTKLRDEGRSAFHHDHVKKGAFGEFLKAVERGDVPVGSVLVVESLDRLSRASVDVALTQLLAIISRGITIVTASDDRGYSGAGIANNPLDLIVSITIMIRANEESATKARRILDAAHRNAKAWQERTSRKRAAVGRDPGWVRYDAGTNEYDQLPEFVVLLMTMIGYFRAGASLRRFFAMLREAGIALPPPKLDRHGKVRTTRAGTVISGFGDLSRLYETMGHHALVGEKEVTIRKTKYHQQETYVLR
jgi:hypothetical protein